MKQGRKRFLMRQKQKRRGKNVSFKRISLGEKKRVVRDEAEAIKYNWAARIQNGRIDARSLLKIEEWHGIKFKPMLETLRSRFPGEKILVLDEGAGESTLKHELMQPKFGGNLHVTTTDVRKGKGWTDKVVNVMSLVKEFGKNRFHLIVSTVGGAFHSPLEEKALFQIVSVLRPEGVGIVTTDISRSRLLQLAKRFNITIQPVQGTHGNSVVFTKNLGRKKKR